MRVRDPQAVMGPIPRLGEPPASVPAGAPPKMGPERWGRAMRPAALIEAGRVGRCGGLSRVRARGCVGAGGAKDCLAAYLSLTRGTSGRRFDDLIP